MRSALILAFTALPALPLSAAVCSIDIAAVEARIAELEPDHGMVLSDISCDMPTLAAHVLMCASAEGADPALWRMGRLDDLAWVHAVQNATGEDVDEATLARDSAFIAIRDACTDQACLCEALVSHTNDSLGGTSPYPQ